MNKKNGNRMGRTVISGVLILGMVLCNTTYTEAKKVSKQESVYATAGADGQISEITVADWLQDSGLANGTLKDISDLTDITNVKGDEKFSQSGDSVEWSTAGQDIYYQGKTTKELPVSVQIRYTLDGEEMTAQDMLGKSGKMEMHVTYTNQSKQTKKINGEKKTIYTPFVMATGMILSSDNFSNIEIDHGRVINDGSNNIVVGMGVPGLAESLGLDDDDAADKIPQEFTIKADVTDFSMGNTFTFGSPSLLNDLDLDDVDDLDDLEEKLNDLTDATDKLLDGSDELAENMNKYDDKMGDLRESVRQYNKDGIKKITGGIRTLAKSGSKLVTGVNEYADGVVSLAKGAKSYVAGADKIAKGNSDLYSAVSGLPAQIKTFDAGLTTYTSNVDKMGTAENATKLKAGTKAVSDGITKVNDTVGELQELQAKEKQLVAGLKQQLKAAGVDTNQIEAFTMLDQVVAGEEQYIAGLKQATGAESDLKKGADTVAASVGTVMDGLNTLSKNSSTLTKASGELNKQVPVLVSSIKTLKEGGETLVSNDKTLKNGADKLIKASKTMKKSAVKLNNGMKTLNKGGKSLQKSTNKLVSGVNQLESASGKLADGADTLSEGVSKFSREGIQKLNDVYEDDFKTLLDRVRAVVDAGKDYNNFSGIGKGMDGDVKFVIETESVKKED